MRKYCRIVVICYFLLASFTFCIISSSCFRGAGAYEPPRMPLFPWPPPRASARFDISNEISNSIKNERATLKDVDNILRTALEAAGYNSFTYFGVPDGFALVTQLEQIKADGSPKEGIDRWSSQLTPLSEFSIMEYLRTLFTENPGYFRTMVFIVTPHSFSQSKKTVSKDEAIDWHSDGLVKLPSSVARKQYSDQVITIALIYEFEQTEMREPSLIQSSRVDGRTHLEKSGFLHAIKDK